MTGGMYNCVLFFKNLGVTGLDLYEPGSGGTPGMMVGPVKKPSHNKR